MLCRRFFTASRDWLPDEWTIALWTAAVLARGAGTGQDENRKARAFVICFFSHHP